MELPPPVIVRTYAILYQNPDFMPIARDPETSSGWRFHAVFLDFERNSW